MDHRARTGWTAALALAALAAACAVVPAGAHTVGGPCLSALEHCERWSAAITGPPRPAGQRPDDFPSALAVGSSSVFAGATSVNLNLKNPYISTAAWTVSAYDQMR